MYINFFKIPLTARYWLTDFLAKVSFLPHCTNIKSKDLYDRILLKFSMYLDDPSRYLLLRRGDQ